MFLIQRYYNKNIILIFVANAKTACLPLTDNDEINKNKTNSIMANQFKVIYLIDDNLIYVPKTCRSCQT